MEGKGSNELLPAAGRNGGEKIETPDHAVFRCMKIRRVKDERGEDGVGEMRWDSWEALASKKWVRMEGR